jgi:hypothetical protein
VDNAKGSERTLLVSEVCVHERTRKANGLGGGGTIYALAPTGAVTTEAVLVLQ